MKQWKKLSTIMVIIIVFMLSIFVIMMKIQPETISQFIGYRFYVVLSDSMEPVIPTYSLVFSKMLNEDETIDPNTIVTFQANRFGKEVLLTHYFKETQACDHGVCYRTQGAEAPNYDSYETTREDLVGTYVFHVPYIGKFILFLQSKFGLVLCGELMIIWLIHKTILMKWEEDAYGFMIYDVVMQEEDGLFKVYGSLKNNYPKPVRFINAQLELYGHNHRLLKEDRWFLTDQSYIFPGEEKRFTYITTEDEQVAHLDIRIEKFKY